MVFGNSIPTNREESVYNYWTDRQTKYISDGTVGPGSIPSSALPERFFPIRQDHSVYPRSPRPPILPSDIDDVDDEEEDNPRKLRVGISSSASRKTATVSEERTKMSMEKDDASEASITNGDIRTDSQGTDAKSKNSDKNDKENKKKEENNTKSERSDSTVSSKISTNTDQPLTKSGSNSDSRDTVRFGWKSVPVTTISIPNTS
ncbi:hypothetical protein V865_005700 [Kwoniella europaea PYCC6329]|uniref:Uncharacterized protein n=1 Tax=Kwoniella europaea PYCC6329 TaxID=1423913 RepID=A0AAX4KNQ1_9TREE